MEFSPILKYYDNVKQCLDKRVKEYISKENILKENLDERLEHIYNTNDEFLANKIIDKKYNKVVISYGFKEESEKTIMCEIKSHFKED